MFNHPTRAAAAERDEDGGILGRNLAPGGQRKVVEMVVEVTVADIAGGGGGGGNSDDDGGDGGSGMDERGRRDMLSRRSGRKE